MSIVNRELCTGCSACSSICPQQCISMTEDEAGFKYPDVDYDLCVKCGRCKQVCPAIIQPQKHSNQRTKTFAAICKDLNILKSSASGGIFTLLAKNVLEENGVVFGARFNNDYSGVYHDYITNFKDIYLFQGSKYIQSDIGNTYHKARQFLQDGRKVLFSGTPCQIAGLNNFLGGYNKQLITVEVVCHGVPSPLVWRKYIHKKANYEKIQNISFRDKNVGGWSRYGFLLHTISQTITEPLQRNAYMQGFLKNLYLRPSCFSCCAKSNKSNSDITLGDFWKFNRKKHQQIDTNLGISLVLTNTINGEEALKSIENSANIIKSNYSDAIRGNPYIEESCRKPPESIEFWESFYSNDDTEALISKICSKMAPSSFKRILNRLKVLHK